MKGGEVSFLNFLMIGYGSCQVKDSVWSERYEDEEKIELGNEDYNPPMVHTETFEVTKYKFNNGCSFICVSGESNETLSLGRKNGSRFRKMIMEEMKEVIGNDGEDSDNETYNGHESNLKTQSRSCEAIIETGSTHYHVVTLLNLQQL
ncbi:hypothetical protein Tco_0664306 [Tanacetum coccineum]